MTTVTAPAVCAGAVAVIEVLFTTTTLVTAVPPSFTVAPAENPVPITVTEVPPLTDPEFGDTEVTVGAGAGLEPFRKRKLATDGTPALFKINNM